MDTPASAVSRGPHEKLDENGVVETPSASPSVSATRREAAFLPLSHFVDDMEYLARLIGVEHLGVSAGTIRSTRFEIEDHAARDSRGIRQSLNYRVS